MAARKITQHLSETAPKGRADGSPSAAETSSILESRIVSKPNAGIIVTEVKISRAARAALNAGVPSIGED